MGFPATLKIDKLRIAVHLGVGEDERATLQHIDVHVTLFFQMLPAVCEDESYPFICYDTLCVALQKKATERPYKLIEYVCKQLHDTTRCIIAEAVGEDVASTVFAMVRVVKCNPPIKGLLAGTSFTISDASTGV